MISERNHRNSEMKTVNEHFGQELNKVKEQAALELEWCKRKSDRDGFADAELRAENEILNKTVQQLRADLEDAKSA